MKLSLVPFSAAGLRPLEGGHVAELLPGRTPYQLRGPS